MKTDFLVVSIQYISLEVHYPGSKTDLFFSLVFKRGSQMRRETEKIIYKWQKFQAHELK